MYLKGELCCGRLGVGLVAGLPHIGLRVHDGLALELAHVLQAAAALKRAPFPLLCETKKGKLS